MSISVEQYMPLVFGVAKKLYRNEQFREWDDLVSDGYVGLVRAFRKYSESNEHSASFPTLAKIYVRGAMIDGIRQHNRAGIHAFKQQSLDFMVDAVGYDCEDAKDSIALHSEMLDVKASLDSLSPLARDSVLAAVTGEPAHSVAQRHSVKPSMVYDLREKFRNERSRRYLTPAKTTRRKTFSRTAVA